MAAPTVGNCGSNGTAQAAVTVALPTTAPVVGDRAIIVIAHRDIAVGTPTPSDTAGFGPWSQVSGSPVVQGAARLTVWQAVVESTTPTAPSVSDSGDHQQVRCFYVNHPDGTPVIHATQTSVDATSDTSGNATSPTTTVNDCVLVLCAAGDTPDTNGTAEYGSVANTSLTGVAERADNSVTTGGGSSKLVAIGTKATAGAVNDWTYTKANAGVKSHLVIAFSPPTATTYFGSFALPITFGKELVGQRKTFGQTLTPLTFGKAVAGYKQTFGQILTPLTFEKAVVAQRETFAQFDLPITIGFDTNGIIEGDVGVITLDEENVGSNNGNNGGTSHNDITVDIINPVAPGGRIFVQVCCNAGGDNSTTGASLSGGGLSWTKVGEQMTSWGGVFAALFYADCPSGISSGTLTCSFTAGTFWRWIIVASSYISTTGFEDDVAVDINWANESNGWSSDSTDISDGALLITGLATRDTGTITPVNGTVDNELTNEFTTAMIQRHIEETGGSYTNSGTWVSSTTSHVTITAAFKPAAGGPETFYGSLAMPITLNREVVGFKETFGQTLFPVTFGKAVAGHKQTFGQTLFPITFGKAVLGQRKTFGQIALPIVFGKEVLGQRKTFGQTLFPITFGKAVLGQRKTFGQIALPISFGKAVAGSRKTFGQLLLPITFGKAVAGRKQTFGQFAVPVVFSKAVDGRRQTFGQLVFPITTTIFVDGFVTTGPITHFGQLSLPLTFDKLVTARRQTFGQFAAPFIFDAASQGWRQTFSEFELPVTFAVVVESGPVGAYGVIDLGLVLTMNTAGIIQYDSVILNDAVALYLGETEILAVYAGDIQVWP